MKYGGAEPGDRTMIDALHPALVVLEASQDNLTKECLTQAAQSADQGAQRTATMVAKAGRASYVSRDKVRTATMVAKAGTASYVSKDKVRTETMVVKVCRRVKVFQDIGRTK